MSQADDRQATGGVALPSLPGGRFWRFELRRAGDTAGTKAPGNLSLSKVLSSALAVRERALGA
jgi:hypothetical protein